MSSPKIKIFRKELPSIKVIEKFTPDVINFETKEDFIEYLDKHREELDKLSTCKLNKLCKIKDYRITKIDGEISLKSNKYTYNQDKSDRHDNELEELKLFIKQLSDNYHELINKLSEAGIIDIAE